MNLQVMLNDYKLIKVSSFHFMFFTRTNKKKESLKRIMREYLFNDTFMITTNAFADR